MQGQESHRDDANSNFAAAGVDKKFLFAEEEAARRKAEAQEAARLRAEDEEAARREAEARAEFERHEAALGVEHMLRTVRPHMLHELVARLRRRRDAYARQFAPPRGALALPLQARRG